MLLSHIPKCVTLSKSRRLSEPQLPCLSGGTSFSCSFSEFQALLSLGKLCTWNYPHKELSVMGVVSKASLRASVPSSYWCCLQLLGLAQILLIKAGKAFYC